MAKAIRQVVVGQKQNISPNMQRVVLEGEALEDFPTGFEGGYIKLVLPDGSEKPPVRSYTIRSFDPEQRQLAIDMVAHGDAGPAARWANQSKPGAEVSIQGPGATQPINSNGDWFLLAGDMSALPAIAVNLQRLPEDAVGHVVLEIISEQDKLALDVPPGMKIHWVINPEPEAINSVLEDTVMALPWQDGQVAIWVAGEFSASRALRQYFRHVREVPNEFKYVSCYWKIGDTDEGMKAAKRADSEGW
ncbi:MAG: siderophore-interacting protein [Pseudomonadales bacterium]|jgi:NADPH-dependent ferric siderophore reductase